MEKKKSTTYFDTLPPNFMHLREIDEAKKIIQERKKIIQERKEWLKANNYPKSYRDPYISEAKVVISKATHSCQLIKYKSREPKLRKEIRLTRKDIKERVEGSKGRSFRPGRKDMYLELAENKLLILTKELDKIQKFYQKR